MSEERAIERFVRKVRSCLEAGFPILWIVSHEEQRVLDLLRKLVPGWQVPLWSCTQEGAVGLGSSSPVEVLALAAKAEQPTLLVMLDVHAHLRDPVTVRALRDFAAVAGRGGKHAVILSPVLDLPVELEKDVAVLDLPLPDEGDLRLAARGEAKRKGVDAVFDETGWVRAAGGLTWLEARRAFRMAFAAKSPQGALQRIVSEKRRAMRRSAALELVETDVGLDDVGGLEVLKGWLQTRVTAFGEDARAFGLPEPRGLMVCGVQGCGKSLVAKATARVFGLPLVRLDFASVFASSSPELTVRQATSMAEAIAPVVLWVDEIEKGLGRGLESGSARVFGDFLIWMQEKRAPVFVAATANEVEHLPPELVRRGRFDEVFFVDLPSARERAEILAIHLRRRGRDPEDHPIDALTKEWDHYSGAEIEQLVISAMFRAFGAKRDLLPEDLRLAGVELVPLATMYEERVQALRTWAKSRARRASADRRTLELFED